MPTPNLLFFLMETKIPATSRSPSHRWQWLASEEHCAMQTWDPSKLQSKVYIAPGPNTHTHTHTHRYSGNWSFKKWSFSWLWHSLIASIQFHLNFSFEKKIGPSLRFSVLSWSRNSIFCWVAELGRCDLGLFEEEKREITN